MMRGSEEFIQEYETLCRKYGLVIVCGEHHMVDRPQLAKPAPDSEPGQNLLPSISEHIAKLRRGQEWTLIQRRDHVIGG